MDNDPSEETDNLPIALSFEEGRVLGSLIEKAMTTPDHYPLTMNALFSACNQKSNRDPVVEFEEDEIQTAIDGLREKHLCSRVAVAGARVPKYRHTLERAFPMFLDPDKMEVATTDEAEKLNRRRIAIIGALLLRGQQTLGELRTRTERMYHFGDLDAVQSTLDDLAGCPAQSLAKYIPSGGGRRVATFIQLLTAAPPQQTSALYDASPALTQSSNPPAQEEIEPSWREKVESDIAELRAEIDRLKSALGED